MKANIHPEYQPTNFICNCGNSVVIGSTLCQATYSLEECNKCGSFYTGHKRGTVGATGAVAKYMEKLNKLGGESGK